VNSLYLKAGAIVISFVAGFVVQGWRMGEDMAEFERAIAQASELQANAVLSIERLSREKSEAISAEAAAELRAHTTQARTVTKEVIRYVQDPGTGKCDLPAEWVRTHNQAANVSRAASAAGASSAATARTATDRDALIAVTENYDRCNANLIQHKGLIDWAKSIGQ
jgi:hypothetical protein